MKEKGWPRAAGTMSGSGKIPGTPGGGSETAPGCPSKTEGSLISSSGTLRVPGEIGRQDLIDAGQEDEGSLCEGPDSAILIH